MERSSSSKEDSIKEREKEKEKEKNSLKDLTKEKEKEKSSPEEDFHLKSVLKDESFERSASVRESSGSNSFQNRSGSLPRNMRNSDTDLDKIIAGKDKDRLNSNSNVEFKEAQRLSEQDKNRFRKWNYN